MNDFINRHRAWLNGFEGFQTHVFAIESQLTYTGEQAMDSLLFEAALDFADIGGDFIDFGEWIYLKGKGFFAKKIGKTASLIRPGIPDSTLADISHFIKVHSEELEHIKGFFAKRTSFGKKRRGDFLK